MREISLESKRSISDHVICDSDLEGEFARSLESSREVKVYAKLTGWLKVDTSLGSFNPDWAALVEMDGRELLCFVVCLRIYQQDP